MKLFLALAAVLILLGPGRYLLWALIHRPADPVPCTECGITDGTRNVFGRCSACQDRTERTEQTEREQRMRAYAADTTRWRAQREAERIAARFPLLAVGSVYRNEHGEPVFEGFEFSDPTGTLPPGQHRAAGRQAAGSLICGWTPAELHALAHGESCPCLD